MKVLIINKYDNKGGAAIAAKRLYYALEKQKSIEVNFLVQETELNSFVSTTKGKLKKISNFINFSLERLLVLKNIRTKENLFFFDTATFGEDITKNELVQKADIIHLHWTNFGFLSLKTIKKLLALNKPVFWTLHDMWLVTGGCFHSRDCKLFQTKCDNCPFLKNKSKLAQKTFNKKKKIFQSSNLKTIAISSWSKKNIETSAIIKSNPVLIGNPIDTDFYIPNNKIKSKIKLKLNPQKKHIGFIAFNATNKYKGGKYLVEALEIIGKKNPDLFDQIELIAIGRIKDESFFPKNININLTGYINREEKMRDYYNAMDVFVLPSLEENLPLVIQEAMSCRTPVVAFNTGGIPDLIEHKINGYLAEFKNANDLSNSIKEILTDEKIKNKYAENAQKKIIENYSFEVIAKKIISEYQSTLS